jgi:aminomethyltransferase
VLAAAAEADIDSLKYFRVTTGKIAGVSVDISRTGYTGDLGYEIWIPTEHAVRVWDALMECGRAFDIRPAGMLALDVARIEAGLLLVDVDFFSSKKALIPSQTYTPFELGLGRLVSREKHRFIGQRALAAAGAHEPARRIAGLELDWAEVERLHDAAGLPASVSATASRVSVPVYRSGRQVGKATSTTWSPVLKKMIALATLDRPCYEAGTEVRVEVTVEAVRRQVAARVVPTPFFNPTRKTKQPGWEVYALAASDVR